eukprot:9485979-Pyramimonas_sp.AAC.1
MSTVTPAVAAICAFGGAPSGAEKRVNDVPNGRGHQCGRGHWGLRWGSLLGHGTRKGRAKVRA